MEHTARLAKAIAEAASIAAWDRLIPGNILRSVEESAANEAERIAQDYSATLLPFEGMPVKSVLDRIAEDVEAMSIQHLEGLLWASGLHLPAQNNDFIPIMLRQAEDLIAEHQAGINRENIRIAAGDALSLVFYFNWQVPRTHNEHLCSMESRVKRGIIDHYGLGRCDHICKSEAITVPDSQTGSFEFCLTINPMIIR